jgi:hypothetical protein
MGELTEHPEPIVVSKRLAATLFLARRAVEAR